MAERTELMQGWLDRIHGRSVRLALADRDDERVQAAAAYLVELGITPVLISGSMAATEHEGIETVHIDDLATGTRQSCHVG